MEKIMRGVVLSLLVLATASVSNAAWTTIVYTTPVVSEVTLNQTFQWPPSGQQTQWDHEWLVPTDPDFTNVDIISATLTIQSQYTSDKVESIRVDSLANPSLGGLLNGSTVFDVLGYETALDGDVTIYAKVLETAVSGRTILDKSTLDLTYEITKRVWEEDPIPEQPTVPAPAAIVLSSLGAGLVGWLRRRGTV